MIMANKRNVQIIPPFKDLQALMDEHCSENHFDGPLPSVEETAFLAEETDEINAATDPKKSKKRKPIPKQSRASKETVEKPSLTLLPGKEITLETIRKMFLKLTGREPTKEEMEDARVKWEKAHPPSS